MKNYDHVHKDKPGTQEEANQPVFVRDKDFFIRTSPATDKLDGSKLHQYIKNRFKE